MITIIFGLCTATSVGVLLFMILRKYENVDIHYWSIMVLIPIILLAYTLKTVVSSTDAAMVAFCFIYLDSTVLPLILIFSMFRFLNISIKKWIEFLVYVIGFAHQALICLCFKNGLYYSSMKLITTGNGIATKMTSGPLKIIHYIYIASILITVISLLIFGFTKKKTASHRMLAIFSGVISTAIVIYIIESFVDLDFSLLPYLYVFSDVLIAADYDHVHSYDISCIVSEQQKYNGAKGFAAFDLHGNFLSCNEQIFNIIPELMEQRVDSKIPDKYSHLQDLFYDLMSKFEKDHSANSRKFNVGNKVYSCEISRFSVRKNGRSQGYLFDIRDVTEEQKVFKVMESYNDTLNKEVQDKTERINEIQRKVVLGLANTIENRDNNTGGHVKRTSDIIKLLVDEISKQHTYDLSNQKCIDIIRSAPMHDLGKISIDNSILCKPGKLTDEEFAIMRTHSTKSGEIVKLILQDVEEQHFVDTAFNVARYHHERWDGRGYPEGLIGEMIPVEARIMAVADVYDALVSKRCYKEPMSFEAAANIMCTGMGTQFDPTMLPIFLACRSKLEEYYREDN